MSANVITPPRSMLEVYESLPEGTPMQLINNELVMSPSPLTRHQQMLGRFFVAIESYIAGRDIGTTFMAPYDVHFDEKNIFQPDILFISNENPGEIRENGFYGAPDLVIEILSPSTAEKDTGIKKDIYEKYGVKEYWMIDPKDKWAEGYQMENGYFQSLQVETKKIKFVSLDLVLKL